MTIIAKKDADFIPAPEGQWQAVCVDVVDLGMVKTEFQGKTKEQHKIRIVWQIEEVDPAKGTRFIVGERYTLSMHEKATLRKMLESWRGKKYTDEQAKEGIDVEKMVGVNGVIQVVHNKRNDTTYANVTTVMKLMKGMEPMVAEDYVRVKDRPVKDGQAKTQRDPNDFSGYPEPLDGEDDDDDLPF